MKKLFLMIVCVCAATGLVVADSSTGKNAKISDFSYFFRSDGKAEIKSLFKDETVYYLDGFDFENYKASDPSLQVLTAAEVSAIKNGVQVNNNGIVNKVTKAAGPYTVIGHSQGGLRALGYATLLKKQDPAKVADINAIITMSGIDKGLKALEDGLPGFKSRAGNKVNIFGNGLRAAIGIFDAFGVMSLIIPRNRLTNAFDAFISLVPRSWRPYFLEAWANQYTTSFSQLTGMTPKSTYVQEYVAQVTEHSYKKQTGSKLVAEWRYYTTGIFKIKIWYLWIGYVPTYSYYTAYEDTPRFDPSIPVGFIVGGNSKTLSMNEDSGSKVKDVLRGCEIGFGVAEGFHIAKCVGFIGLFTGSVTYAQDADRARRLMRDFESELNDIKGSSANDGLVAKESQYIPTTFYHPGTGVTKKILPNPVLGKSPKGYVEMSQYNHKNIVENLEPFRAAKNMLIEAKGVREKQANER